MLIKVCWDLILVTGIEVIGGGQVGFEEMWLLLVRKPSQMRTLRNIQATGKAPFRVRKGAALLKMGSSLHRFCVVRKIPLFPNQCPNFAIKKRPREAVIKHRLYSFAIPRLKHWPGFHMHWPGS